MSLQAEKIHTEKIRSYFPSDPISIQAMNEFLESQKVVSDREQVARYLIEGPGKDKIEYKEG